MRRRRRAPPEETPEERRARVGEQRLKAEQAKIAEVRKIPVAARSCRRPLLPRLAKRARTACSSSTSMRRTAADPRDLNELEKMNQEAKTRCHDVDDITPFVDGVAACRTFETSSCSSEGA